MLPIRVESSITSVRRARLGSSPLARDSQLLSRQYRRVSGNPAKPTAGSLASPALRLLGRNLHLWLS